MRCFRSPRHRRLPVCISLVSLVVLTCPAFAGIGPSARGIAQAYGFVGYDESTSPGKFMTTLHPTQDGYLVDDGGDLKPIADYGRFGFGIDGTISISIFMSVSSFFERGSRSFLTPVRAARAEG